MIKAGPEHKATVVDIMKESFADYKLFHYMTEKDEPGYEKRYNIFLEYNFEECLLNGEVYLTDDESGVVLWLNPCKNDISLRYMLFALRFFWVMGISRTLLCMKIGKRFMLNHPDPVRYMYLWIIAVRPSAQGTGVSSKMLKSLHQMAAERGKEAIYLETCSDSNVALYQYKGYCIFDEWFIPEPQINLRMMRNTEIQDVLPEVKYRSNSRAKAV